MIAAVSIRPAVKVALLNPRQVIGNQFVAFAIPFIDDRVQIVRARIKCHANRIAQSGRELQQLAILDLVDGGAERRIGICYIFTHANDRRSELQLTSHAPELHTKGNSAFLMNRPQLEREERDETRA